MADEVTYVGDKPTMPSTGTAAGKDPKDELIEWIRGMSAEEAALVRAFVERLRSGELQGEAPDFLSAVDEFIGEHPELLPKLAQ